MKAPKFIIKRVYIERDDLRELKTHKKRLENIQAEDVKRRLKTVDENNMKIQANKSIISEYFAKEKNNEIEKENNQILKKLVEISKGKTNSVSSVSKIQPSTQKTSNFTLTANSNPNTTKSLNFPGRKKEFERINLENEKIAKRLMKINPVISAKSQSKDFEKNKQLGEKILRFHNLKDKEELEYDHEKRRRELEEEEEKQKMLDPEYRQRVEELNNQQVYLLLEFQKLKFYQKRFEPTPEDEYFMEIKACYKALRRTNPEKYVDFAKSVLNEYFNMNELRKTKMLYMGLYKIIEGKETFIGDFEMDLAHYMAMDEATSVSFELRNLKNPPKNYLPQDLDFRGLITLKVKLRLNVNKSTKLKELSPVRSPKKGGKNVGFSEKALFDRQSSKVLYDSMKLSRKYANGGSNSNLPNNDAPLGEIKILVENLKIVGEKKIGENIDCFFKIEAGSKSQEGQKFKCVNGNVAFNETINFALENEKEVKMTFWYIENESSFVLIGNGQIDLSKIPDIQKKMVNSSLKIIKDGVESGVLSFKAQALSGKPNE